MIAVEQKVIPFTVNTGNQGIGNFNSDEITDIFSKAVQNDIKMKQAKGFPVARYDIKTKKAYLENIDGSREYV